MPLPVQQPVWRQLDHPRRLKPEARKGSVDDGTQEASHKTPAFMPFSKIDRGESGRAWLSQLG